MIDKDVLLNGEHPFAVCRGSVRVLHTSIRKFPILSEKSMFFQRKRHFDILQGILESTSFFQYNFKDATNNEGVIRNGESPRTGSSINPT